MDMANDIQESLGQSYGIGDVDEGDLEAELDALGDEMEMDGVSSCEHVGLDSDDCVLGFVVS